MNDVAIDSSLKIVEQALGLKVGPQQEIRQTRLVSNLFLFNT